MKHHKPALIKNVGNGRETPENGEITKFWRKTILQPVFIGNADMQIGLLGLTNADDVTIIEKNSSYIINLNIKNGNGWVYS